MDKPRGAPALVCGKPELADAARRGRPARRGRLPAVDGRPRRRHGAHGAAASTARCCGPSAWSTAGTGSREAAKSGNVSTVRVRVPQRRRPHDGRARALRSRSPPNQRANHRRGLGGMPREPAGTNLHTRPRSGLRTTSDRADTRQRKERSRWQITCWHIEAAEWPRRRPSARRRWRRGAAGLAASARLIVDAGNPFGASTSLASGRAEQRRRLLWPDRILGAARRQSRGGG